LIRLARQEDAAAVSALVNDAFVIYVPRTGGKPLVMLDDYPALISQGVVHILEDVGELAGLIVLIPENMAMLLHCVAVRPDAQGRGLGRLLLTFAETKAREAGYDEIRLITNPAMFENLAIYKHYGYGGEVKGRHAVYMAKQLVRSSKNRVL
jgi:ribosomal protein S18 acetylase RimI-like enzyme